MARATGLEPVTYGLTVAPRKSPNFYTRLRNATESAGLSACSFCVAKNLHYRVATCVKNIQKTERVKHDLRNILIII